MFFSNEWKAIDFCCPKQFNSEYQSSVFQCVKSVRLQRTFRKKVQNPGLLGRVQDGVPGLDFLGNIFSLVRTDSPYLLNHSLLRRTNKH